MKYGELLLHLTRPPRSSRSKECKEGRHEECNGFLGAARKGLPGCQCKCPRGRRHGTKAKKEVRT